MSLFAFAFSFQPATAWTGVVYIGADGSIDPPTAPIVTSDKVTYTLTGNITTDADGILVERENVTIDGAGYTVNGSWVYLSRGIDIFGVNNVIIKGVRIENFYEGIKLIACSGNSIFGNNITNNMYGISLENTTLGTYSSNNKIFGNNITRNGGGIYFVDSCNNSVSGNMITGNDVGIIISSSSGNSISGNTITNDIDGIWLEACTDTRIRENNITDARGIGIRVINDSSNNSICYNDLIGNTQQVYSGGSRNTWDNGYPSGGNYWSNYAGSDPNGDGIGDTPYVIEAYNQDNYPLMKPWAPAAAAVLSVAPSRDIIGKGYNLNLIAMVVNQGNKIEELNVTFYANTTFIGFQTLLLWQSGGVWPAPCPFTWNTTGFVYGRYTLSACIQPLEGEVNLANNNKTYSAVRVTVPGDLNGDFKVGTADLYILGVNWGLQGSQIMNPNADINGDGKVGTKDLQILGVNWGKSSP